MRQAKKDEIKISIFKCYFNWSPKIIAKTFLINPLSSFSVSSFLRSHFYPTVTSHANECPPPPPVILPGEQGREIERGKLHSPPQSMWHFPNIIMVYNSGRQSSGKGHSYFYFPWQWTLDNSFIPTFNSCFLVIISFFLFSCHFLFLSCFPVIISFFMFSCHFFLLPVFPSLFPSSCFPVIISF